MARTQRVLRLIAVILWLLSGIQIGCSSSDSVDTPGQERSGAVNTPSGDPCLAVDCGPGGVCVAINNQASCECDPGYHAEGLTCLLADFTAPISSTTSREDILKQITGTTYYLDASAPSGGNGSSGSPWNNLTDVMNNVSSGDGVLVSDGDYGSFEESNKANRTGYIVLINAEGATPEIDKIVINNSTSTDAYLIFSGFKITPLAVDPASSGNTGADDPQYPVSDQTTYAKSDHPVYLYNANFVKIYNSEISSINKHLSKDAIYMTDCSNVTIELCNIHTTNHGISYQNSHEVYLYYNHIHDTTSSFIVSGTDTSSNVVIEGNHAHDMNWSIDDDWAPRAKGSNYHGSLIAMRHSNIIVRNNILHDGGTSSGIMFYSGSKAFSNILFENNLVYDTKNTSLMRIYMLGDNVLFKNNTFIGRGRYNPSLDYTYNAAFVVNTVADGYNGSGLYIYNNIFVGIVVFGEWKKTIHESNNIFWTAMTKFGSTYTNLGQEDFASTTKIASLISTTYFESGFFNEFDVSWPGWDSGVDPPMPFNPPSNGSFIDLTLDPSSEGINFGNPAYQPTNSLGSVDTNGFILIDANNTRDDTHHSVGCYESN